MKPGVFLSITLFCAATATAAQHPVTIDDLMKLRWIADVQISPDGDRVAYVVSQPNVETDTHDASLYVASVAPVRSSAPPIDPLSVRRIECGSIHRVDDLTIRRAGSRRHYTYAKATDNLLHSNLGLGPGAQGGGSVPTDNLNLNFDRGPSVLAVKHTFVMSGVALLPAAFTFSGVLRYASGEPFTASGAAKDYDGDGISSRRPVGTTRNEFTGPSTFNVNLRLEKSFGHASFLVEGFNVTNAKNPRLIDASYVAGAPSATFGNVLVPLPGRELQLGLRLRY